MDTIFSLLFVSLAGVSINFTAAQGQKTISAFSKALSPSVQAGASAQKNAVLLGRGVETNDNISRLFQVSPDPRDQVQLSISNGIITLQGSVGSDELAQKLVHRFGQISGVHEVHNQLTVRAKNRDSEIAAQLREALSRDPTTHAGIAVTVYRGMVFLSGVVSSEEERTRAEELARNLRGVTRVENDLRVPGTSAPAGRLTSAARSYTRTR